MASGDSAEDGSRHELTMGKMGCHSGPVDNENLLLTDTMTINSTKTRRFDSQGGVKLAHTGALRGTQNQAESHIDSKYATRTEPGRPANPSPVGKCFTN